ncbi:MAG TPA: hypothetical protein VNX86_14865 [Rhizomicrobium sp.]|jgi:hypothetical protein|nr:hypothetical protein [Rhizomicrobium sp.]
MEPKYWVDSDEVDKRLNYLNWTRNWLLGWRDVANSKVERTVIFTIIPKAATDDSFSLLLPRSATVRSICCLLANLNALPFDYIARQKVGGTHLRKNTIVQLPVLPPDRYSASCVDFVATRVLELIYTADDVRAFAEDLGYDGLPFRWDADRRSLLRAELDAYYAYLYGLTKRELEYILDPKAVMGSDHPSETFRVLKENECKQLGEYRTQRLVLDAWDRFVADGTFDVGKLRDPQYIDRVAEELSRTRARLEESQRSQHALLALAGQTPKPTLFVEGATDVAILESAWSIFFANQPLPVKVLAAGGTKEMGSLAGSGRALREVLGNKVVLALADNDAAGRKLIEDGHIKKGGVFKQLTNGIHWCLLKPTDTFAAAMKAHDIPSTYWPFTLEAAFAPSLRRLAADVGAWRFSGTPQSELLDNPDLARRLFTLLTTLGPDDDAYWYLMAPASDSKDAFAKWITQPERRTETNYAAFEEIMRGLRNLLARPENGDVDRSRLKRGAA